MEKKGDLIDFERRMVVGARQAGLCISKMADLLGFTRTTRAERLIAFTIISRYEFFLFFNHRACDYTLSGATRE